MSISVYGDQITESCSTSGRTQVRYARISKSASRDLKARLLCAYGLYGDSASHSVSVYSSAVRAVPNYAAWRQRHIGENNLPTVNSQRYPVRLEHATYWSRTSNLENTKSTKTRFRFSSYFFCRNRINSRRKAWRQTRGYTTGRSSLAGREHSK